MKKKITNEQMNAMNWRYKKQTAPVDEFADMNGPVKIIRPVMPKIPTDLPPKLAIELHRDNIIEYAAQTYISNLPHPFKCSKCGYIAKNTADSKQHWLDHD